MKKNKKKSSKKGTAASPVLDLKQVDLLWSGLDMGKTSKISTCFDLPEFMARMSRRDLLQQAFYARGSMMPIKSYDDLIMVDPFVLTFAIHEVLEYVGPEMFKRWAEETGHDDIETDDSLRFFDQLRNMNDTMITMDDLHKMLEAYLNEICPPVSTSVLSSFNAVTLQEKEYYLPALKVLNEDKWGHFWSPVYVSEWKNHELGARHLLYDSTDGDFVHGDKSAVDGMRDCSCGVYASVNVEEMINYLSLEANNHIGWTLDPRFPTTARRLCIIEPYTYAAVFTARKGWRASRAFISEIVGETIDPVSASNLLSMTWNRRIDVSFLLSQVRP